MSTAIETERKFLTSLKDIRHLMGKVHAVVFYVEQHYLSFNPEIRIRAMGSSYYLTKKQGKGIQRKEYEQPISKAAYEILKELSEVGLEKNRVYIYSKGQLDYSIDIYNNFHKKEGKGNIVIIEKEFDSLAEANNFQPPTWFGVEVTDKEEYKNQSIARFGFPEEAL